MIILGTLSHFLYEWTNQNFIISFFVPVNESTWEHMKLLFFPMLLYSCLMIQKFSSIYPCITSSMYFGTLLGTFLIPVIFCTYTGILGYDIFIFDIITFILSVIIAFWTAYKLTLSCRIQDYGLLLHILILIGILCFVLFTYRPPDIGLFAIPSM